MPFKIDVWTGDLHQHHVGSWEDEDWQKVSDFMQVQVEAGMLCNVLHTDFQAPAERVAEAEKALAATLNK